MFLEFLLPILAIAFTVFSFWWLNARKGRIEGVGPQYVFGCYKDNKLQIQLPVALRNTGPQAIVVSGFRVRFLSSERESLLWIGFSSDPMNGCFTFKKPVVIKGFDATELILFFQREECDNLFSNESVRLEFIESDSREWSGLSLFDLPSSKEGWSDSFSGIDLIGGVATGESLN